MSYQGVKKKLESIMLSKISQRKTNTTWYHLSVESPKAKIHRHRKQMVATCMYVCVCVCERERK